MFKHHYPTQKGTDLFPNVMNPPAMVRVTVIYDNVDEKTGRVPEPEGAVVPPDQVASIMHFVNAFRQNYGLGVITQYKKRVEIVPRFLILTYQMQQNMELVDLEIYPDRLDKEEEKEPSKYLFVAYGTNQVAAIDMGSLPLPDAPSRALEVVYQGSVETSWEGNYPQFNRYLKTSQLKLNLSNMWLQAPIQFVGDRCSRSQTQHLYVLDLETGDLAAGVDTQVPFFINPIMNGSGDVIHTVNGSYSYVGTLRYLNAGAVWEYSDYVFAFQAPGHVSDDGLFYHGNLGTVWSFVSYLWGGFHETDPNFDVGIATPAYEVEWESTISEASERAYTSLVDEINSSTSQTDGWAGATNTSRNGAVESVYADATIIGFGTSNFVIKGSASVPAGFGVYSNSGDIDRIDTVEMPVTWFLNITPDGTAQGTYTTGFVYGDLDGGVTGPTGNFGINNSAHVTWPPPLGTSKDDWCYVADDKVYFPGGDFVVAGEIYPGDSFVGKDPCVASWMHLSNGQRWIQGWVVNEFNTGTSSFVSLNGDRLPEYRRIYCCNIDITTQLEAALGVSIFDVRALLIDLPLDFIRSLR